MIQMNIFTKDSDNLKSNLWIPKGKCSRRKDKSGVWDEHTHTPIYKIDNQQGLTVWNKELYSMFCDNLYEKRI